MLQNGILAYAQRRLVGEFNSKMFNKQMRRESIESGVNVDMQPCALRLTSCFVSSLNRLCSSCTSDSLFA